MLFGKGASKAIPPIEHGETQAVLEKLSYCQNSSQQNPVLAHHHNRLIKESTNARPHFLNLPTAIRHQIFSTVLICRRIVVDPHDVSQSEQPPLTRVCRDIRQEALAIWYRGYRIWVDVRDFDMQRLLAWYERAMLHDGPETPVNFIFSIPDYMPSHFENLQEWLCLAHAGKVVPLLEDNAEIWEDEAPGCNNEVIVGVFEMVMSMKQDQFESGVTRLLPGLRRMLDRQPDTIQRVKRAAEILDTPEKTDLMMMEQEHTAAGVLDPSGNMIFAAMEKDAVSGEDGNEYYDAIIDVVDDDAAAALDASSPSEKQVRGPSIQKHSEEDN